MNVMDALNSSFSSDGGDGSAINDLRMNLDPKGPGINMEMYGSVQDMELNTQVHIKKLSEAFEGCIRTNEANMKVYLRIRPVSNDKSNGTAQSTIQATSNTSITTTAPDNSKRAQYTKTEERHYVSS